MEIIKRTTFKEKVEAHQDWLDDRDSNPSMRLAVKDAYITGVELHGANLSECDFRKCHFHDCKFVQCTISESDFKSDVFSSCTFLQCDLHGTDFSSSDIRDTDFCGSNMSGCSLDGCIIDGINLYGCCLDYLCFPLIPGDWNVKFDAVNIGELLLRLVNSGLESDVGANVKGTLSNIAEILKNCMVKK